MSRKIYLHTVSAPFRASHWTLHRPLAKVLEYNDPERDKTDKKSIVTAVSRQLLADPHRQWTCYAETIRTE